MDQKELQAWWDREPFQPFRILTSKGERYDVRYRAHIWLLPSACQVGFFHGEHIWTGESVRVPYDDIIRIEDLGDIEEATDARRNELQSRWDREPFTPFRLITATGERYDIRDRRELWIFSKKCDIGFLRNGRWTGKRVFLPISDVAAVEEIKTGR